MLPKKGKYFNIKNPRICSCPVKIAIPVNNKIKPPILVTRLIYLLKFFEKEMNL